MDKPDDTTSDKVAETTASKSYDDEDVKEKNLENDADREEKHSKKKKEKKKVKIVSIYLYKYIFRAKIESARKIGTKIKIEKIETDQETETMT